MDALWRARLGYFAFGLLIGIFLFPWLFVAAVREQLVPVGTIATGAIWFAVLLGPAVLAMLAGWNKGRADAPA